MDEMNMTEVQCVLCGEMFVMADYLFENGAHRVCGDCDVKTAYERSMENSKVVMTLFK